MQSKRAQLWDGRYELEHELGRGAMSVVYRAVDRQSRRRVAVKMMLPPEREARFETRVGRFRREAHVTRTLTNRHVVRILDDGLVDGLPYLVLELLEGELLAQRIDRLGPLLPYRAARIAMQICGALAEAHDRGFVHRDLKPDNIFLQLESGTLVPSETVKVMDFGISFAEPLDGVRLTDQGLTLGTPAYMSPEQCADAGVDGRSDLYALGVILYEMLTGRLPFDAPTHYGLYIAHMSKRPPALDARLPAHQWGRWCTLVESLLAKSPSERPPTARAVAELLAPLAAPPCLKRAHRLRESGRHRPMTTP